MTTAAPTRESTDGVSSSTIHEAAMPTTGTSRENGATWLAGRGAHAVGADTIAFECLHPGAGHSVLPAHRVLLVENGIYIVEAMALEELAADALAATVRSARAA